MAFFQKIIERALGEVKTKNLVCFQKRERERITKDFGNPEKA